MDGSETEIGELVTKLNGLRTEFGLTFGGEKAASLGSVVAADEEGWMAFERAGLLVVVSNEGAEKACFKSDCCPGEELLGLEGEDSVGVQCDRDNVCVELGGGIPLVFSMESC